MLGSEPRKVFFPSAEKRKANKEMGKVVSAWLGAEVRLHLGFSSPDMVVPTSSSREKAHVRLENL